MSHGEAEMEDTDSDRKGLQTMAILPNTYKIMLVDDLGTGTGHPWDTTAAKRDTTIARLL